MAETAAAGGSTPLRPAGVPTRRGASHHARALTRERDPRASPPRMIRSAAQRAQVGARAAVGGRYDGGDGRSWRQRAAPAGWRAIAPRCAPPRPRAEPRARSARQLAPQRLSRSGARRSARHTSHYMVLDLS
jgi:hypothetical protein